MLLTSVLKYPVIQHQDEQTFLRQDYLKIQTLLYLCNNLLPLMIMKISFYCTFFCTLYATYIIYLHAALFSVFLYQINVSHLVSNAAAAAAKLLQSCQTLCNPMDGSPPGSTVPGILQARTLEWGAIAFSGLFSTHTHNLPPYSADYHSICECIFQTQRSKKSSVL